MLLNYKKSCKKSQAVYFYPQTNLDTKGNCLEGNRFV